ncbi:SDR family NAD(P)-dependent oxidoreductase [Hamadaea tsunoensis]|uniref:SDR family NAD(P)-dependent oxidoreductase n=1 Tax=Hamadaea tsunoensis TaxID=53368 RepID=UPI000422A596|nr:SDR family oxidoreductase [Hamadaea tsunoensis]
MDLHLSGKVAVVTGASRGIGLAVVQALAAEGATVVAGARHVGDELAALAHTAPVRATELDLSTADGPARLVAEAVAAFGGIDILVNNVGAVRPRTGGFLSVSDEDWLTMWTVNLMAAVRTTRAALPHLLRRGAGSIVTVASANARLPDPMVIDYGAAKAGLLNFSKALSKEVGGRGIRMNTVSPGPVSTALWLAEGGVATTIAEAAGSTAADVAAGAAGASVTGRFSRPDEVAALVVYLAGDRSGNVTGADFVVDGGLIATL